MCLDENILDRIKKYSDGKQQGPAVLELYPTLRCNSRCLACLVPGMPKDILSEIPSERYLEIIREASELGVYICYILGGGEPLCRADLIYDLVEKVKYYKMKGMLTTNGMFLSESLAKIMAAMKWDFIHFSVDGPDAYIHDQLRGVEGAFERAVEAIRSLNLWKKRLSTDKPSIEFNTVLSARNYHVLPRIFRLSKEQNVDYITIIPVIIHLEKMQDLDLNNIPKEELLKSLRETREVALALKINSNIEDLLTGRFSQTGVNPITPGMLDDNAKDEVKAPPKLVDICKAYCLKPWYHLVIQTDGGVGPCCNFQENECNITNEGIREIWFGDYFNNLRKLMLNRQPPPGCLKCSQTLQADGNRRLVEKLSKSIS